LRGIALGNETKVYQTDGIAIGSYATSSALNSYVFGQNLTGSGSNSITIGVVTSSSQLLSNNKPNSIMFGVNERPSLTILKPTTADVGYLGINTVDPKQMVHIEGGNLLLKSSSTSSGSILFDINNHNFGIERINSQSEGVGLDFWVATKVHNPNDTIIKRGNSLSMLFLGENGRVGIGTRTPETRLDVSGSFKAWSADIAATVTANDLSVKDATITNSITANDLSVRTANIAHLTGTTIADNLRVENLLCAKEVKVQLATCWPDYVFAKDYNLLPLSEVEQFINENQHLPNIPSAAEVAVNGIELGEMNAKLLLKVEELTLYIIQMEKRLAELESKKGGE
jgi:hypothetical protein